MGRVSYTGITDGATRSAANMNALVTPFNTESSSLDSGNYRDEGMDAKVIADGAMTDGREDYEYNAGMVAVGGALHPAYVIFNPGGGTGAELTNSGAGWSVGQNVANLRVVFGAMWQYTFAAHPHVGAYPSVYFKVQYRIDGAAYADVTDSEYIWSGIDVVADEFGVAVVYDDHWYESCCYEWDIPYPSDGASHTINSVRVVVAYGLFPAVISYNNCFFRTLRHIKAVV